jgi:organic radical activating enzyme
MKKHDESYLDYKKRVIDSISGSFCAAKWYNATLWLGNGATTSCHHPPPHKVSQEDVLKNPKALHNTTHKKVMRSLMLKGERPPECEYCWKIEDMKRDNVSDRVYKTVIYSDEDIRKAQETPVTEDVNLKTLEISFDRVCNFACSYCNAGYSTRWARDIKDKGIYQGLVSDGAAAFMHDGSWAEGTKEGEPNPYIDAFWKWWPELSKSLMELRVTGGEPLMCDEVWKLFDYFKKNGSGEMVFSVNSNLGSKDSLIDRLIESSHYVKRFMLYSSCETTGKHAEYIRDGLDYERYCNNVHKILSKGKLESLNMMMTINSLSLFSITDYLDQMLEWKKEFGWFYPVWSVNILRFPSFMSPGTLPPYIREDRSKHLKAWLTKNWNHPKIHEMERDSLQRLVDYLDSVDDPHRAASPMAARHQDFKLFYLQYDKRRGKDFRKTFPPILTDWFDSIPEPKTWQQNKPVVGDATEGYHDSAKIEQLAILRGIKSSSGARGTKKPAK